MDEAMMATEVITEEAEKCVQAIKDAEAQIVATKADKKKSTDRLEVGILADASEQASE
jgi:hypothetical protein